MNSSSINEEKLKKLSAQYKACLDNWQNQVKTGKGFLDSILQIRKETSEDPQEEESYVKTVKLATVHKKFCSEFHEQCVALMNVAKKFDSIAAEIEAIQVKGNALVDLANLSNSQSYVSEKFPRQRLVQSLKVVSEAYKEQSKLMLLVAESIGVCLNFDQVVFYAAIWTHQPYLDQNCFIAENIVTETF